MDTIWWIFILILSQGWKIWWGVRWARRYFSWTYCERCGEKTVPLFTKTQSGDFFCSACDQDVWAAYLERDKKEDPLKPKDESDRLNLNAWPIGSKERMAYESRSEFWIFWPFIKKKKKVIVPEECSQFQLSWNGNNDNPNIYK